MANFWEKIKSVIFVEEPVDEPEEVEEEHIPTPEEIKAKEERQRQLEESIKIVKVDGELVEEKKEEVVVPQPIEKPEQPSVVTLDGKKPVMKKKTVKQPAKKPAPTTEYQFTQVISPIYGVKEEPGAEPKVFEKPVSYSDVKPAQESPLGTVLSPISGAVDELKNQQVPNEIANLTVDDLISEEFTVEPEKEEVGTPTVTPVHKQDEMISLALFDDDE